MRLFTFVIQQACVFDYIVCHYNTFHIGKVAEEDWFFVFLAIHAFFTAADCLALASGSSKYFFLEAEFLALASGVL
jgi:hypothetical protein